MGHLSMPPFLHLYRGRMVTRLTEFYDPNLFKIAQVPTLPCSVSFTLFYFSPKHLSIRLAYYTEKAMAPHSSTLAWKILWTEEPGKLQSMGSEESDTTEQLHFHFSLSCIGEGNGNPLQCSCLENPRDGGAWWAAVYGVTQSQTRLKRLSSSSSSKGLCGI